MGEALETEDAGPGGTFHPDCDEPLFHLEGGLFRNEQDERGSEGRSTLGIPYRFQTIMRLSRTRPSQDKTDAHPIRPLPLPRSSLKRLKKSSNIGRSPYFRCKMASSLR